MSTSSIVSWLTLVGLSLGTPLGTADLYAHCDGMDGPVVKAAQQALATGNVNPVLIWVRSGDEAEVRKAFAQTLAVRKLNSEARALADMYFFETVVRLHRAGEGEPYTGVKPAGRDLGPAIPAADQALESGSAQPLVKCSPRQSPKRCRSASSARWRGRTSPEATSKRAANT